MPGNSAPGRLILASTSPRRHELLTRLGVPFSVVGSGIEERDPERGEDPAEYALSLAREKADEVAVSRPGAVVLGADTVVTIDGQILNKPHDDEEAMAMLRQLAGRAHRVITAVVARCGDSEIAGCVASEVTMREAGEDELRRYVASGEPMDKAGSYAVQGLGGALVERVTGCYNTVVGLPLCLTAECLRACGFDVATPARAIDPHDGAPAAG